MSLEIKQIKIDMVYHKIIDGIVEEIKIGDDIYRLVKSEPKPKIKKPKKIKDKILGKEDTYGVKIYQNEVTLVMDELLKKECSNIEISDQTGLKKYRVNAILKWLKNHRIIKRKLNEVGETVYRLLKREPELELEKQNTEMEVKTSKKPKDGLEFSESYKVWITEDSVKKVMQAINHVELDYIPTSESIQKQSGLSLSRCRATLQYLCEKGTIKGKRDRKTRIVTYR